MRLSRRHVSLLAGAVIVAALAGLGWHSLATGSAPTPGAASAPSPTASTSGSPSRALAAAGVKPSASPKAGGPAATPSPSASGAAAGPLNRVDAAKKLMTLADAYNAATAKLQKVVSAQPVNLKAVRAATPVVITAYRRWLDGLRATRWPAAAQPAVNAYLKESPVGVKALNDLLTAKTASSVLAERDPAGMRRLKAAEATMRTKLLGGS
jgi:hypothetical protein